MLLYYVSSLYAVGQVNTQLNVGERFPDLTLTMPLNYDKDKITTRSFPKKWKIITFWSMGCLSAVKAVPKLFDLQNRFERDIQVIAVTRTNDFKNRENREVFQRMIENYSGDVIGVFDHKLFDQFNVTSVPLTIIVNPKGIIHAITTGSNLTESNIEALLSGRQVSFAEWQTEDSKQRKDEPIIELMKDPETVAISLLRKWNGEPVRGTIEIADFTQLSDRHKKNGFFKIKMPLARLYSAAYFGRTFQWLRDTARYGKKWITPILEIEDTSPFAFDEESGKNVYNYYFKAPLPLASQRGIQGMMQAHLEKTFGYRAIVKKQMMPVLKLVIKDGADIRLCDSTEIISDEGNPLNGLVFCESIIDALARLTAFLPDNETRPFIDATGINKKIYLEIPSLITDLDNVKADLNKQGFDLVDAETEMDVLVLTDPD